MFCYFYVMQTYAVPVHEQMTLIHRDAEKSCVTNLLRVARLAEMVLANMRLEPGTSELQKPLTRHKTVTSAS